MNTVTYAFNCGTWGLGSETADAESILRRFTRNNRQHPTYKTLSELGKTCLTIFLCRYLNLLSLRYIIQEGLNIIEQWNRVKGTVHIHP